MDDIASENGWAKKLRGFGPVGLLAIATIVLGNVVFIPLTALLVLLWAWASRTPWDELGFSAPRCWWREILGGFAFGCLFKLGMKTIVMPLLGAPPRNEAFQFLVGNAAALPSVLYAVLVGAAFGEEVLFRGYAFERLGKLFGSNAAARALIVVLTASWFGYEHFAFQGVPGVQQATVAGVVFGTIFALRRCLWFLIIAHAAFDLTAVAIIYADLEENFARLLLG